MTLRLDLPDEIEQELTAHAAATGKDIVRLIETAVVRFIERDVRRNNRHRLLPDEPMESTEIAAPVDLPLCGAKYPVSTTVREGSHLRPDPPVFFDA